MIDISEIIDGPGESLWRLLSILAKQSYDDICLDHFDIPDTLENRRDLLRMALYEYRNYLFDYIDDAWDSSSEDMAEWYKQYLSIILSLKSDNAESFDLASKYAIFFLSKVGLPVIDSKIKIIEYIEYVPECWENGEHY